MSLFVCQECRSIENTALSPRFWSRRVDGGDPRALCSACDPAGPQEWHGRFERRTYDGTQKVGHVDGRWLPDAHRQESDPPESPESRVSGIETVGPDALA